VACAAVSTVAEPSQLPTRESLDGESLRIVASSVMLLLGGIISEEVESFYGKLNLLFLFRR
jgi:hypothetical protein